MKSTALKESANPRTLAADPARQAFLLLRTAFTVAPILFGLDKFTNLLTDWTGYLAPVVPDTLHLPAQTVMYAVGVVEIIAGILVALRPRIGSHVVAAWLLGIIVNLLILGAYYDVALRDFGLFVGALALNRLATAAAAHQPGGTTVSH
ncbi:DoxX family membrane protein [Arthrobacter sp. IA7]|uniref:DoxX family membrane protein n=1 Tax=Arthrobacter ipis TaxID=2716202 RepID=UPI0016830CC1|nr:DoxX family membrane protein [Arthrobacter ipis]MBD1540701.1 DoxX family membrane protein [Arthrobacter ipis]